VTVRAIDSAVVTAETTNYNECKTVTVGALAWMNVTVGAISLQLITAETTTNYKECKTTLSSVINSELITAETTTSETMTFGAINLQLLTDETARSVRQTVPVWARRLTQS
jgi:hypothetical protein